MVPGGRGVLPGGDAAVLPPVELEISQRRRGSPVGGLSLADVVDAAADVGAAVGIRRSSGGRRVRREWDRELFHFFPPLEGGNIIASGDFGAFNCL